MKPLKAWLFDVTVSCKELTVLTFVKCSEGNMVHMLLLCHLLDEVPPELIVCRRDLSTLN